MTCNKQGNVRKSIFQFGVDRNDSSNRRSWTGRFSCTCSRGSSSASAKSLNNSWPRKQLRLNCSSSYLIFVRSWLNSNRLLQCAVTLDQACIASFSKALRRSGFLKSYYYLLTAIFCIFLFIIRPILNNIQLIFSHAQTLLMLFLYISLNSFPTYLNIQ